jgi:hypothetical protein
MALYRLQTAPEISLALLWSSSAGTPQSRIVHLNMFRVVMHGFRRRYGRPVLVSFATAE